MHRTCPALTTKWGGTKGSEYKEVNEFREKITKFPNFPNLLKFFIRGETPSVSVYSDLGCCRKAVKEKISTKGQARLKPKVDIYYFNDSQSYPKSASAWKRNKVSPKVFWVTFLQKRDGTRFLRQPLQPVGCVIGALWGVRDIIEVLESCEGFKVRYRHHISRLWFMSFSHCVADSKCCALEF